nr:uncharacterized protein LOC121119115 [Lepeophtheirus salmonis]
MVSHKYWMIGTFAVNATVVIAISVNFLLLYLIQTNSGHFTIKRILTEVIFDVYEVNCHVFAPVIVFNHERVNYSNNGRQNPFNISSGIFTSPIEGMYVFQFRAIENNSNPKRVDFKQKMSSTVTCGLDIMLNNALYERIGCSNREGSLLTWTMAIPLKQYDKLMLQIYNLRFICKGYQKLEFRGTLLQEGP